MNKFISIAAFDSPADRILIVAKDVFAGECIEFKLTGEEGNRTFRGRTLFRVELWVKEKDVKKIVLNRYHRDLLFCHLTGTTDLSTNPVGPKPA